MKRYLLPMALLLIGCASPAPEKLTADKSLYEWGNKMYAKERYADAAPYFEDLKNRFPDSPFALDAEMKVADSHFFIREYESAQVEYESFRALHPTNEKIPYVYLQIGKCQMYQAPKSVQKDQTQTEQALMTFNQLQTRWPESKETTESKTFKARAEEKLAAKQLYVANFYIGQKKYFPALRRLESLNKDETPQPLRREALFKLGVVHLKMKNTDIAKQAFEKIVSEKVDDQYQRKANNYLARLK